MQGRHAKIILWGIFIGVVLGIALGAWLGPAMTSVEWLGTLFLNALKMTIIPLIIAAVISGVTSLGDVRKLGRIGGLTIAYYASTTALAVSIGLVVVNLIRPGANIAELSHNLPAQVADRSQTTITDIVLDMITPNLIESAANTELLPLIIFSLLFAAALTTIGEIGRPVITFFEGLNQVMMKLVVWIVSFKN